VSASGALDCALQVGVRVARTRPNKCNAGDMHELHSVGKDQGGGMSSVRTAIRDLLLCDQMGWLAIQTF
jgi:hypothetical protein